MDLKFCPNCGSKLESNAQFCDFCGADLRERIAKETIEPSKSIMTSPQQPSAGAMAAPVSKTEKEESPKETYASFGYRFLAWILDIILLIFTSLIIIAINASLFGEGMWLLAIIVSYFIFLLYFWLLEAFNNGRTLGKMAFKLRTVNKKTLQVASTGDYLVNNLLKSLLPLLIIDLIIGILKNIGDPHKRLRIMQNASNTVVIKE
ncbi:MAG: RDD family protein [Promethearchaeota archaeon]